MINETKKIIITGGLGGIGKDIVKFFYIKGYNIIIIYFKKQNNFIKYYKIDLSKPKSIKLKLSSILKVHNNIDVLINCAGIQHIEKIESFPNNKWEKIININLSSSFYMSKYILPLMKKKNWGRIINIASVHGQVASINKSAYVASKHGLIGLTKALALETAKVPITCNAICPGWVYTSLVSKQIKSNIKKNKSNLKIETKNLLYEKHPSMKFVSGNSIASMAYYLCSDDASEITGSSINIDGGWTAQ